MIKDQDDENTEATAFLSQTTGIERWFVATVQIYPHIHFPSKVRRDSSPCWSFHTSFSALYFSSGKLCELCCHTFVQSKKWLQFKNKLTAQHGSKGRVLGVNSGCEMGKLKLNGRLEVYRKAKSHSGGLCSSGYLGSGPEISGSVFWATPRPK